MLCGLHTLQKGMCSVYILSSVMMSPHWRHRGGEWCHAGVITRCGAEGWEPNGYFILSIGLCKWKCQSGWETNESDTRDATSPTECLINCHCLSPAPMFFVIFFFIIIVFPIWPGCLWLGVWWWTLSWGNKGIDWRTRINSFICYLQVWVAKGEGRNF